MRKLRLLIASAVLAFGFIAMVAVPVSAAPGDAGDAADDVCAGIKAGGGNCNDDGKAVGKLVKLVVNILSAIAGVAAVIMIIVSGLKYITSGGEPAKIAGAKTTLMYSIVGLFVVVFAQVIVRYVLDQAV